MEERALLLILVLLTMAVVIRFVHNHQEHLSRSAHVVLVTGVFEILVSVFLKNVLNREIEGYVHRIKVKKNDFVANV